MTQNSDNGGASTVDFFGIKLKVNNPGLAALLNSAVTEDVQVVGQRARDAFAGDSRTEFEDGHRERVVLENLDPDADAEALADLGDGS